MNWEQRYNEQTEVAALLAKQRDDALERLAKFSTCYDNTPMTTYRTRPINLDNSPTNVLNEVKDAINAACLVYGFPFSFVICSEPMIQNENSPPAPQVIYLVAYKDEPTTKTCDSSSPCPCVDDDLNEPLGEPSCQLGGECESCQ